MEPVIRNRKVVGLVMEDEDIIAYLQDCNINKNVIEFIEKRLIKLRKLEEHTATRIAIDEGRTRQCP